MNKENVWRDERILFSQMNWDELLFINPMIEYWGQDTEQVRFVRHLLDRLRQKHITKEEVLNTITNGKYIELHIVNDSARVLIREQLPNRAKDVCVVLDIVTGTVVTAYLNDSNDHHKTLREELYDSNLDVIDILVECIEGRR